MKKSFLVVLILAPFLAGCTDADWDKAMSTVGLSDQKERILVEAPRPAIFDAAPASSALSAQSPDPFCQRIAIQEASEDGPDKVTQLRRAGDSYRDCVASFGAVALD